jgi:hypothetical protein
MLKIASSGMFDASSPSHSNTWVTFTGMHNGRETIVAVPPMRWP